MSGNNGQGGPAPAPWPHPQVGCAGTGVFPQAPMTPGPATAPQVQPMNTPPSGIRRGRTTPPEGADNGDGMRRRLFDGTGADGGEALRFLREIQAHADAQISHLWTALKPIRESVTKLDEWHGGSINGA